MSPPLDRLRTFVLKLWTMQNSFSLPLFLFSASSAPQRFNRIRLAFSAASSLTIAATTPQMARGGTTGAFRGVQRHQPSLPPAIGVDSAALAERAACHFGGCIATEGSPLGHHLQLCFSLRLNPDVFLPRVPTTSRSCALQF